MDAPYDPNLIYQTYPFHQSPPWLTPPPAPEPGVAPFHFPSHVAAEAGAHGPPHAPPTPAPSDFIYDTVPPHLAPAYFALPYSYAYPAALLFPAMPARPYVPLLSRIQLTEAADCHPGAWPYSGRRHSGRANRATAAIDAVAESAYGERRGGPATQRDRRSASPGGRSAHAPGHASDSRGRSRSVVPLAARLSSPTRADAGVPSASDTGNARRSLADRLSSPSGARAPASSPAQSPPRARPPPARSPPPPAPLDRVPTATFRWDRPDRDVNTLRAIPGQQRVIRDDDNVPRRTRVPIREGHEVLWYLNAPFEDDDTIPVPRLPHESAQGPAPSLGSPQLRPVPPGDFLLHPRWGPFRMASWKRNGAAYMKELMLQEAAGSKNSSRTLSDWADAFRPTGYARREYAGNPADGWTDDLLFRAGFFPASENECREMVWENDMFLFRRDFEMLAMRLHGELQQAPADQRGAVWARIRDSIRRAWGPGLTYFPDARSDDAFLDSEDDLIRLRHWRALARIMSQWDLPTHMLERVQPARGGTVRDTEADVQEVLEELAQREFSRGIHAFPRR
ncbi:hypothetical protein FOMPIDRAFT_88988, partial [Fomitopsis schrenkii]